MRNLADAFYWLHQSVGTGLWRRPGYSNLAQAICNLRGSTDRQGTMSNPELSAASKYSVWLDSQNLSSPLWPTILCSVESVFLPSCTQLAGSLGQHRGPGHVLFATQKQYTESLCFCLCQVLTKGQPHTTWSVFWKTQCTCECWSGRPTPHRYYGRARSRFADWSRRADLLSALVARFFWL